MLELQIQLSKVRMEAREAQTALAAKEADFIIEEDARKRSERQVQQFLKEITDNGDPKRTAELIQRELLAIAKIGKR